MNQTAKKGAVQPPAFDAVILDKQFGALESDVDEEAKSDAIASVHGWKTQVEKDRLENEVERLREEIRHLADTRTMRRDYAQSAINLARSAVMFWVGMFCVVGISNALTGKVPFSDQALVTLTAGATVNVLAAFIGIIRGLFPSSYSGKFMGGGKKDGASH